MRQTDVLNYLAHINSWEHAIYNDMGNTRQTLSWELIVSLSDMSQNFRLLYISDLSILISERFLPCIRGQRVRLRAARSTHVRSLDGGRDGAVGGRDGVHAGGAELSGRVERVDVGELRLLRAAAAQQVGPRLLDVRHLPTPTQPEKVMYVPGGTEQSITEQQNRTERTKTGAAARGRSCQLNVQYLWRS